VLLDAKLLGAHHMNLMITSEGEHNLSHFWKNDLLAYFYKLNVHQNLTTIPLTFFFSFYTTFVKYLFNVTNFLLASCCQICSNNYITLIPSGALQKILILICKQGNFGRYHYDSYLKKKIQQQHCNGMIWAAAPDDNSW
jgi:hypothetical protein